MSWTRFITILLLIKLNASAVIRTRREFETYHVVGMHNGGMHNGRLVAGQRELCMRKRVEKRTLKCTKGVCRVHVTPKFVKICGPLYNTRESGRTTLL